MPGDEKYHSLLRNFLISVTNFFHEPVAFTAVETIIPQLFADKGPNDQLRVWVAGCATGDEAYSIAMLLAERATQLSQPLSIQVEEEEV